MVARHSQASLGQHTSNLRTNFSALFFQILTAYTAFVITVEKIGSSAGFDMVPPLSEDMVERHNWDAFIENIKSCYGSDAKVELKPNYINFNAGDNPKLPFEGHKFLRFSSQISGTAVEVKKIKSYIETVTIAASLRFGSRVRFWNECTDQWGKEQQDES